MLFVNIFIVFKLVLFSLQRLLYICVMISSIIYYVYGASDVCCEVPYYFLSDSFSALTLLVGRQEGHPACKKLEWWGAGVVICLERGADLHMAQLIPLPLTVSCFSKIQIGFYLSGTGSPG